MEQEGCDSVNVEPSWTTSNNDTKEESKTNNEHVDLTKIEEEHHHLAITFDGSNKPLQEPNEKKRLQKRNRVILFGYVGLNYRGLQTQGIKESDPNTVEKALFHALVKVNGIAEWNADDITKLGWQRSSRTDAGVSAAAQLVNLQLQVPGEEIKDLGGNVSLEDELRFVKLLNENLPSDIQVYRTFRVARTFDSKNRTSSRRYLYFFPLSALKSNKNADESEDVLKQRFNYGATLYQGTSLFHNFTDNKLSTDPSTRRFIKKCGLVKEEEYVVENETILCVEILGQSFLYNQIRRMIGFLILCIRNNYDEECIRENVTEALDQFRITNFDFTAPAIGLFLDVIYTLDETYIGDHIAFRYDVDFETDAIVRDARNEFKRSQILPSMFPVGFAAFAEWIDRMDASFEAFDFFEMDGSVEDNKLLGEAAAFLRVVENRRRKRAKFERRTGEELSNE